MQHLRHNHDYYIDSYKGGMHKNRDGLELNERFDKIVQKFGRGRVFWACFAILACVIVLTVLFIHRGRQNQRFEFDNNVFTVVSVDRTQWQSMRLTDTQGNILSFTSSEPVGARTNTYTINYLDGTRTVTVNGYSRRYVFSNGSSGNNARNQRPNVMVLSMGRDRASYHNVGFVPHFTHVQQLESQMFAAFINFYENYAPRHVMIIITLVGLGLSFFGLLGIFYADTFHVFTRPFQRTWQADLRDAWLDALDGKVSVTVLLIYSLGMIIFVIATIRLFSGTSW